MARSLESKLIPFTELKKLSQKLHAEKRRIVTTNGCFDLLHLGHIQYLLEAKALGDVLICGLNSDLSVRNLKGADRPLVDEKTRALQIAGLESIDYVCLFTEATPVHFIEQARPAIHVKGGDYDPKALPERAVVEAHGGKVICLSLLPGYSTSSLIAKIRKG